MSRKKKRSVSDSAPSIVEILSNEGWTVDRFRSFLEGCGDLERVSTARLIVIKPNLCAGTIKTDDTGVVVSKQVLGTLLSHFRALNPRARLVLCESDSVGFGFAYDKFSFQGYAEIAAAHQAELVDVSRTALSSMRPKQPLRFRQGIWLSTLFDEADYLVSFGKLKTHNMTTVSISMKNLFGCLPDADKSKHHPWIDRTVVDIVQTLGPDLQVIDSSPALEGNGPVHGTPVSLNYLMLGNDPVAVDATGARILGFDPRRIDHIRLAQSVGVGKINPDRLTLPSGLTIEAVLGRRAAYISTQQKFLSWFGLRIQQLGIALADIGHLVHLLPSFAALARGITKRGLRISRQIGA